jgi:hypothetical protein
MRNIRLEVIDRGLQGNGLIDVGSAGQPSLVLDAAHTRSMTKRAANCWLAAEARIRQ